MSYPGQNNYLESKYDGNWFTGLYHGGFGHWYIDEIYFDGPGCAGFVTDTMCFSSREEAYKHFEKC